MHTVYDKQQKCIRMDEVLSEMQSKLDSLARQKQLAIETRRFQNAAAWTNQIKTMDQEMTKLKADQQQQQQTDTEIQHRLKQEQQSLDLLIKEHEFLKEKIGKYTRIVLYMFL